MEQKTKVGMISLGCPKNLVDSEVMLGHLQQNSYEITASADDADVMVVNTCAFIEESKQESIDTILEMVDLKNEGKIKKLIVAGCLAQRYAKELEQEIPEVDHFLGTGHFENIVEVTQGSQAKGLPMAQKSMVSKPKFTYDYATPRLAVLPSHTAYVKIAEGCSRTCSFCIIPKLRGPGQSRSIPSVVQEVENLAERGVKEIHLIAQDLTAYGLDRKDGTQLKHLLKALDQVEGIEWIRLMYAYPQHIDDELIEVIGQSNKICSYLDMPLQHIDSDLLATMRRKVDEQETRRLLKQLRERIPGLTFRTTFIVGFPGETEQQFLKLKDFIEEMAFDRVGVFTYSQEENTGAGLMNNQLPQALKDERKDILMQMQQQISYQKNQSLIGKKVKVLVDRTMSTSDTYACIGRTEGQALDIDGNVFFERAVPVGQFTEATIADTSEYDLFVK